MADTHQLRPKVAEPARMDGAAVIVIAYDDGRVVTWSKDDTPELAAWADGKLQQAAGLIAGKAQADG